MGVRPSSGLYPSSPICLALALAASAACGNFEREPPRGADGPRIGTTQVDTSDVAELVACESVPVARIVEVGPDGVSPETTRLQRGRVVEWRNRRPEAATITSGDETHPGEAFPSGELAPTESFCLQFTSRGSFHYYSEPQGSAEISGVVRVQPEWF